MFNKYNKYLVQINYKSGRSFTGWFYNFRISNDQCSWEMVSEETKFLKIGIDDIESVFQVKLRRGWKGQKP